MSGYERFLTQRLAMAEDRAQYLEGLIRKAIEAHVWYFNDPFKESVKVIP